MKYDTKVPEELKKTQQWFGSIISRPIDDNSRINPISPSGKPIEKEATKYISPSPTLRPAQRIELYNQQYWWRLLNNIQEIYPLLSRLFGAHDFNKTIAIPYIVKYPPNHWSLSLLGDRLVQWIEDEYDAVDKPLVLDAAKVDWAFNYCFVAPLLPPITTDHLSSNKNPSSILKKKIYLQPHVQLFEFDCNMFIFRKEFIQHPHEYWLDNDFPKLEHGSTEFYYLSRTKDNNITWNIITQAEYHLLCLFQKGSTIEKACSWLENQDTALNQMAMEKLHLWFQEWTVRRWLSLQKPNASSMV